MGGNVNAWWWVPIGLAAWFLVAVVMALCIGAVSQARLSGPGIPRPAGDR